MYLSIRLDATSRARFAASSGWVVDEFISTLHLPCQRERKVSSGYCVANVLNEGEACLLCPT